MKKVIAFFLVSILLVAIIIFNPRTVRNQRKNPATLKENVSISESRLKNYSKSNLETLSENLTNLVIETIEETNLEVTSRVVEEGDKIRVNYIGWRATDGGIFDQSFDYGDGGFTFTVGNSEVIEGWDKGTLGMKVGEIRKLKIPSNMAYGAGGAGEDIPPNTDIIFYVELIKFEN